MNTSVSEDVKGQIIDAAMVRFSQYGYNKTTMAEIAKDCQMSAANLYRYFANKEDIIVEIGNRCVRDKEAILKEVLSRPGLKAAERFEAFTIETLRYGYNLLADKPHLSELIEFICRERTDVAACHMDAYKTLLSKVIEGGNHTGEFEVTDPLATAGVIQMAFIKYTYPPLMMQEGLSLEELESQTRALSKLVVRGLEKR